MVGVEVGSGGEEKDVCGERLLGMSVAPECLLRGTCGMRGMERIVMGELVTERWKTRVEINVEGFKGWRWQAEVVAYPD